MKNLTHHNNSSGDCGKTPTTTAEITRMCRSPESVEIAMLAQALGLPRARVEFVGTWKGGEYYTAVLPVGGSSITAEALKIALELMAQRWAEFAPVDWRSGTDGRPGGRLEFDFETGEVSGRIYYDYDAPPSVRVELYADQWNIPAGIRIPV